jgi:hypothetical protein
VIPIEALMPLTPADRKNREHQGEAHVRFRFAASGLNSPERTLDQEWLAEIDEAQRARDDARRAHDEALQAKVARQSTSILWAAWLAVAVGIVAAALTWYTLHLQNVEAAHNSMIKDGLARYIAVGSAIKEDFAGNQVPMPILDKVSWEGNVDDFLRANLCEFYVARFHDNSGLAPISANHADPEHNDQYAIMFHEIARLEEFSHETPSC